MECERSVIVESRAFMLHATLDPSTANCAMDPARFIARCLELFDSFLSKKEKSAEQRLRDANRRCRYIQFCGNLSSSGPVVVDKTSPHFASVQDVSGDIDSTVSSTRKKLGRNYLEICLVIGT